MRDWFLHNLRERKLDRQSLLIEDNGGKTQSICTKCEEGSYCEGDGIKRECRIGEYANGKGLESCIECDFGQYQDEIGQNQCTMWRNCGKGFGRVEDPDKYRVEDIK